MNSSPDESLKLKPGYMNLVLDKETVSDAIKSGMIEFPKPDTQRRTKISRPQTPGIGDRMEAIMLQGPHMTMTRCGKLVNRQVCAVSEQLRKRGAMGYATKEEWRYLMARRKAMGISDIELKP